MCLSGAEWGANYCITTNHNTRAAGEAHLTSWEKAGLVCLLHSCFLPSLSNVNMRDGDATFCLQIKPSNLIVQTYWDRLPAKSSLTRRGWLLGKWRFRVIRIWLLKLTPFLHPHFICSTPPTHKSLKTFELRIEILKSNVNTSHLSQTVAKNPLSLIHHSNETLNDAS